MDRENAWYQEGLRFRCTGCGKCCTGSPGIVWVSEKEGAEIAAFLGISIHDFQRKYTRLIGEGRRALLERGREWDCIFLHEKKRCLIYPVRPKQCKTFPWWKGVVASREGWEQTKEYCEGIDHPDGPLVSSEEIEETLHSE